MSVADYERTLTVAAPLSRVWRAFTDIEDLRAWHGTAIEFQAREGGRVLFRDAGYPEVSGQVRRVVPERLLHWDVDSEEAIAIIEEFASSPAGTIVTVRQHGSVRLPARERQAYALGWDESLADMALLVEHGVRYSRHMSPRCQLGAEVEAGVAGLTVVAVTAECGAAEAGLQPGDLLVRLGGAPVFGRSDLALLMREHRPGTRLEVAYVRDARMLTGVATLNARA
jgi:uncharacterized protein YndB with AHSA1/START domain